MNVLALSDKDAKVRRGSEAGAALSVVEQARQERLRIIAEAEAKEKAEAAALAEQRAARQREQTLGPQQPRPDTLPLAPVKPVWMRVKGIWMQQAWDPDGGRMRLTPADPETAERLSQREVELAELRQKTA
ncbi:hypothetical protein WJX81_003924 [Elliptochloris bilobata]|uniref:Uncharacterized protein n=1 Tax=Elliptochloris bilobata TaxID=381761 RepID=A0AAW1QYS1_9CHLO